MKRVVVGLRLTGEDESILKLLGSLSRPLGATSLRFLNVVREPELTGAIADQIPQLKLSAAEAEAELKAHVEEWFQAPEGCDLAYEVAEGNRADAIVRRARENEADLLVVGRRTDRSSVTAERSVRKAPCSVLMIPQGCSSAITRILVPVDFSSNSLDALKHAITIASQVTPAATIVCYHAYTVPLGYHKAGKTYEEFAEIMRHNAEAEFDRTAGKIDTHGVTLEKKFELLDKASEGVSKAATEANADLIVMGARGRTAGAALVLGSVTERVLRRAPAPVLAVKQRDKAMSIFDALLGM